MPRAPRKAWNGGSSKGIEKTMRSLCLIAACCLTAYVLLVVPTPFAFARPLLVSEVQSGCEALVTSALPDRIPQRLQRQARRCADVIQKLLHEREEASNGLCLARAVPLSSAAGAVFLYLRDNLSTHEQPFESVARTALLRFLPCRPNRSP